MIGRSNDDTVADQLAATTELQEDVWMQGMIEEEPEGPTQMASAPKQRWVTLNRAGRYQYALL